MAEIEDWETTDSSNVDIWPEGQSASSVNNAGRAMQGLLARFHEDLGARKSTTGSANAYLFAAAQTLTAYYDGLIIGFDANFAVTGAATLNVDSLGAKSIKKHNDQDLASGDIEVGQKVLVVYDGVNFQMLSPLATIGGVESGTVMLFHQSAAPTGWTKDTAATLNNSALRVVTSTAWASGKQGATAFDSVFGSGKTAGNYTLAEADIPSHSHTQRGSVGQPGGTVGADGVDTSNADLGETGTTGGGGAHNHTLSLDLNYINMIIATKD